LSEISFSSKKRNHLRNLLLLQENFSSKKTSPPRKENFSSKKTSPPRKENFSSKKTSPPRKEIIYGICFSSKKTSLPRKEISNGIILLELESR
jgi:hypothetical protein